MNNISAAIDNLKSLEDPLSSATLLRGFGTTVAFLFDFLEFYEETLSNGSYTQKSNITSLIHTFT